MVRAERDKMKISWNNQRRSDTSSDLHKCREKFYVTSNRRTAKSRIYLFKGILKNFDCVKFQNCRKSKVSRKGVYVKMKNCGKIQKCSVFNIVLPIGNFKTWNSSHTFRISLKRANFLYHIPTRFLSTLSWEFFFYLLKIKNDQY